jgi:uncharacterized membrane protein
MAVLDLKNYTYRWTIIFLSLIGIICGYLLKNTNNLENLLNDLSPSFLPGF